MILNTLISNNLIFDDGIIIYLFIYFFGGMEPTASEPVPFQSGLITEEDFHRLKDSPLELVNLLEHLADERILQASLTYQINSEQDIHNLQQRNKALEVERDCLLDQVSTHENRSNPDSTSSKLVLQLRSKISSLEVDLETAQARSRSSLYSVQTKANHIKFIEGM